MILSDREQEIVALYIGMCLRMKQVANILGIATKTVEGHLARVNEKLGTRTSPELARWYWNRSSIRGIHEADDL